MQQLAWLISFIPFSPGTVCLWRPNEVERCSPGLDCQSGKPLLTFVWLFSTVCFQNVSSNGLKWSWVPIRNTFAKPSLTWNYFDDRKVDQHCNVHTDEASTSLWRRYSTISRFPEALLIKQLGSGHHCQCYHFWQQCGTDSGPAHSSAEVP